MFKLKQHRSILTTVKSGSSGYNIQNVYVRYTDFPEIVVVLDEVNSKVRLQKKDGSAVWIRKFFLGEEVIADGRGKEVNYEKALDVFKTLVGKLSGQLTPGEEKDVAEATVAFETVISDLQKRIDEASETATTD